MTKKDLRRKAVKDRNGNHQFVFRLQNKIKADYEATGK